MNNLTILREITEAANSNEADLDAARSALASSMRFHKVVYTTMPELPESLNWINLESKIKKLPLKYGWNDVNEFPPPSGKLQFYTIAGICIYGKFNEFDKGFVTYWAYLLPSPTKQRGALK